MGVSFMLLKIEYHSEEEREAILQENSRKYLIEEQNIVSGNFLIFSDEPLIKKIYTHVPEEEFESLKSVTDILMVGLADTYETQQQNSDMLLNAVAEVYEKILGGVE